MTTNRLLLLGDSHSHLFRSVKHINEYNLKGQIITAQRFCNANYSTLWTDLDLWFKSQASNSTLILCINEIDIRGHYWRHLPRSSDQITVRQFVQGHVDILYQRCLDILAEYSISRIMLWGVPPACNRTLNNHEWPFVGSVSVRNRLIHQFNSLFIDKIILSKNSAIRFSTAFYEYLDSILWEPVNHRPTDGVHWHSSKFSEFWSRYAEPCVLGQSLVELSHGWDLFNKIKSQEFCLAKVPVTEPNKLYDSWVDLAVFQNQCLSQITVCDSTFTLVTQAQLESQRPWQAYNELTLVNC